MRDSPCNRCDPCRVNEGKSQQFGKNRRIVWMPNVAKGPGGYHSQARGIDDLSVPVCPEGANDPPAHGIGHEEKDKHRRSEPQKERTPEEDHFERGANQGNNPTARSSVRNR